MKPRTTKVVTVNETDIHSGDFLGIIRLDGLDPMLAWGMGSTTGHTAIAMRDEAGVLHVLESTTNGSYWPTNGIQSTPWARWVPQAITAGHQVVHAPLSEEARKSFDVTKAREFFATQKDLNYGFGTLLVGWIDTVSQNFPCLPPYDGAEDQSYCLTWELIEVLFPLLSKEVAVVSEVYLEAWNHRIGVKATGPQCAGCLPPADVLMKANQSGIVANTLFSIVESDDWQYSQQYNNGTLTMGNAFVCDVLVCRVWKAGGLFDEVKGGAAAINCGEFTNWDAYVLDILAVPTSRPQQCVEADPDNQLCQLMGDYTLNLNNYGTKPLYAHIAETCPSFAPQYKKPNNC